MALPGMNFYPVSELLCLTQVNVRSINILIIEFNQRQDDTFTV